MKTSELSGAALDWAVHQAWCEGACHDEPFPSYSTDWAQGGPIIERERISLFEDVNDWSAKASIDHPLWDKRWAGPTPLIAAMRCFVASKLGDTIEIPNELTGETE
jgi:hypothetical protein